MPAEAIRINRRVLLQCSIGAPGLKQPFAQPQQNGALSRISPVRTRCSERQLYGYGGTFENFIVTAIWHTNVPYFTQVKGDGRL